MNYLTENQFNDDDNIEVIRNYEKWRRNYLNDKIMLFHHFKSLLSDQPW